MTRMVAGGSDSLTRTLPVDGPKRACLTAHASYRMEVCDGIASGVDRIGSHAAAKHGNWSAPFSTLAADASSQSHVTRLVTICTCLA
jgi:hypothetical protein